MSVVAPGKDIFSTILMGGADGSYGYLSGTSMAAPIVTAVTSLVWSIDENFTASEVKGIVCNQTKQTAKSYKISSIDNREYPIVNAKLAVEEAIKKTNNNVELSYEKIYNDYIYNTIIPNIGLCENYEESLSNLGGELNLSNNIKNLKGLSSVYIDDFNNDEIPEMITVSSLGKGSGTPIKIQVCLYSINGNLQVQNKGIIYETDKFGSAGEQIHIFILEVNNETLICITDHFCATSVSSTQTSIFNAYKIVENSSFSAVEEISVKSLPSGIMQVQHNEKIIYDDSANTGGTLSQEFTELTNTIDTTFINLGLIDFTWCFNFNKFPSGLAEQNKIFSCGTRWNTSDWTVYLKGNLAK